MNITDITQHQTEQQPLIDLILNRAAELTRSEFKIAALLYAAIENSGGAAEMTIAELAEKAGMSWRSAQESRARLIKKGIVAVTSGGREKSRYRLPEAGLPCPGTPKIEPRREIRQKPMREPEVNAEIDRLVFELAGLDRQRAAAIMARDGKNGRRPDQTTGDSRSHQQTRRSVQFQIPQTFTCRRSL